MFLQQLYTNCLAEAAYYIEDNGEAIIIDPLRETAPYLEMLKTRGAKLKYVLETHFHADFVSGHVDLAKATGAVIVFGPGANPNYQIHEATDGEILTVGSLKMKVLHTPGHTPESACYLLFDENGLEYAVFSGDTLFVGDVGRPDLLDGDGKMTKEILAGMMYDSLQTKIKTLPDHVIVYPAHGAGSACGKNIGKETFSTIGEQKKNNYALQDYTRDEFIAILTKGLNPPPAYFFSDAKINKQGYTGIDDLMHKSMMGLSPLQTKTETDAGAIILDTRNENIFVKGFIKKSISIGLNGQYAIWAGTLLPVQTRLVLVTETGKEEESIRRLARVGFDNIAGYVEGGFDAWKNAGMPIDEIKSVTASEFENLYNAGNINILDVRRVDEYDNGFVRGAINIPLAKMINESGYLSDNTTAVHCAGGYRSVIACSILMREGHNDLVNIEGGWGKIKETKIPVEKMQIA